MQFSGHLLPGIGEAEMLETGLKGGDLQKELKCCNGTWSASFFFFFLMC